MGAIKFFDDPSLKFIDDPTPTIKFRDDLGSLKFRDDLPSLKFRDDPKLKVIDDPIGSYKNFDDVKLPALDIGGVKLPGSDQINPGIGYIDPLAHSAQPFILATPHHSMEWARSMGYDVPDQNDPKVQLAQFASHIKELEMMREELQKQQKQLEEYYQNAKKEYDTFEDQVKKSGNKKG